jgi:hypothetical protein
MGVTVIPRAVPSLFESAIEGSPAVPAALSVWPNLTRSRRSEAFIER